MREKIIINGTTLNGGNITPLLIKARAWYRAGKQITFLGDRDLEKHIQELGVLESFNFVYLPERRSFHTRLGFIFEALHQNLIAIRIARDLPEKYDVVYSISSVLDMILVPFFLKKKNKNIVWATVFDNTVPLFEGGKMVAGNKLVRILAWLFYRTSLFFLRKTDYIFVVRPVLKNELLIKGFKENQLIVTGNGVQADLIRNAKESNAYNIDALFIGRINEAKGIYDMLEVLKKVKEKYPDFQLAIMGRGDDRTEMLFKKKILKMHLENNIQFLGYRSGQEKFDIIKSSKTFLFLSETESVPIAPLEAVCSGLKTLVYDLDAYDMYKNNEVIIFKKNDCDAVAQKIIEIFDMGDFSNEKGKLLLAAHDWDRIAAIELDYLAA